MIRQTILLDRTPTKRLRPKERSTKVKVTDGRYMVKVAETASEIESALRLRYEVFSVELADAAPKNNSSRIEFDSYDFRCRHLIVIDRLTHKTVGTYRLNSIESARDTHGFYSYNEFSIEDLPPEVLTDGIEIGRACIAVEHRNTKVLFLLWKGLTDFLQLSRKRFFFGCCSIFTRELGIGEQAYRQLADAGHFHNTFRVEPRKNALDLAKALVQTDPIELPSLFNMYLRIGARVCGPPTVDHDFGTIDFFVVCDTEQINGKYRRMFFS
jgi:putative hemolysin